MRFRTGSSTSNFPAARVEVRCPRCGLVELAASAVTVGSSGPGNQTASGRCPQCASSFDRVLDRRIAVALLRGGAQLALPSDIAQPGRR